MPNIGFSWTLFFLGVSAVGIELVNMVILLIILEKIDD